MPITYYVACKECKEALWIGQSTGGNDPYICKGVERLNLLEEFLFEHRGHDLVFEDKQYIFGNITDTVVKASASCTDGVPKPQYPWPDPKPEDLYAEDFLLVWECIKTWDVNVPEVYEGYCGATGNHVMSILFATGKRSIQDYM